MSKAKPAPKFNTWRVVGGGSSGGIVVRSAAKTSSEELDKRLLKGALVQELELQGERLRFRLLRGGGPPTGWVSTTLKGKDLLRQVPLKVGLLCTGSRGDVQPLVGLGQGLQKAGCEVTVFTHSQYEDFVQGGGLKFVPTLLPLGEDEDKEKEKERDELEFEKTRLFMTRYLASQYYGCPIAGVSFEEEIPEEVLAADLSFVIACSKLSEEIAAARGEFDAAKRIGDKTYALFAERTPDEVLEGLAATSTDGVAQHVLEERRAQGRTVPRPSPAAEQPPDQASAAPAPESAPPGDGRGQEARPPEQGQQPGSEAQEAPPPEQEIQDKWLRHVREVADDPVGRCSLLGVTCALFKGFADERPEDFSRLMEVLENNPPDVMMFHWGMGQTLGAAFDVKFGIPSIPFNLYCNVDASDPTGLWLNEDVWQLVRSFEMDVSRYETLEVARREHHSEYACMDFTWFSAIALLDAGVLEPLLGTCALQHLGYTAWRERMSYNNIVGFLSSVASPQVTSFLGKASQEAASRHNFVGFWMMQDQTTGAEMFGGPKLMEEVEAFLDAGPKPVYIGWGSMWDFHRGKHSMVVLAVSALKEIGMRGIVLGGWAKLSYELLEEAVGKDDQAGLCEYARKNVLFVMKAPQLWLFPKCAAIVIHGGSGTLAAAWTSGVPVIVVPVIVDQPLNGLLNMAIGAGLCTRRISKVTTRELGNAIKMALASPEIRRGAQVVQVGMMRDRPVEKAHECLLDFLAKEAVANPRKSVKKMALEIFAKFDEDGDGYLNEQEFVKFLATCNPGLSMSVQDFVRTVFLGMREEPSEEDLQRGPSKEHILRLYCDAQCRRNLGCQDTGCPDPHLHHARAFGGLRKDILDMAERIFHKFDCDGDGFWSRAEGWEWWSTYHAANPHLGPTDWGSFEGLLLPGLGSLAGPAGWTPRSPEDLEKVFDMHVPKEVVVAVLTDHRYMFRIGAYFDVHLMYDTFFLRG